MDEIRWSAQWIGPEVSAPNDWLCFRKQFTLASVPETTIARVAVDAKYWLWVNNRLVVFEGGLKRGPTPADGYFDEVELAPYLVPGENTLAVLVWFWGKEGFSHKDSGQAGLVLECASEDLRLVSDASWKMLRHPAYISAEGQAPNYRLPEHNVAFDARQDIGAWMAPCYDDGHWLTPCTYGAPPVAPWHRLWPRPIPQWRFSEILPYANAADFPPVSDGTPIIAKLPYNMHITPYLRIDAGAGLLIDMRMDNFEMCGTEKPVHAEYRTREGAQSYESLGWMNGHAVTYSIPAGVKILALGYRESGYDTDVIGAFTCDDEFYNQLWQKALRTLYVTMRDTYMDCPDRERAQWWGDAVIELGEAFYAFDARATLLARKGVHELAEWQREDGSLYSPVPAGNYFDELPPQMLASVGWFGFWTYYRYSGDAETIAAVYPHVLRYLQIWNLDERGLVVHRAGGWDWADWGADIDAAVLDNTWYLLALEAANQMARLCGHEEDLPWYSERKACITAAFDGAFWTGSAYRSAEYTGATDDRANAMAVLAGLAGPEKYPTIRTVLAREFHASPYMEKYVLEALLRMRDAEAALSRMKARYTPMVEAASTTLYEQFPPLGKNIGEVDCGTYNHAWSGGPLTLLMQYVAGVAPTAPGYAEYDIRPQMGTLRRITTRTPTPRGIIALELVNEDDFRLTVTSPAGLVGTIRIPWAALPIGRILVNEQVLVDVAGRCSSVAGVEIIGEHDGYLLFTVGEGRWAFVTERREGERISGND